MKAYKKVIFTVSLFAATIAAQTNVNNSTAKLGYKLATSLTDDGAIAAGTSAAVGALGGEVGKELGVLIGTAIAPGVGSIIGAGVGAY